VRSANYNRVQKNRVKQRKSANAFPDVNTDNQESKLHWSLSGKIHEASRHVTNWTREENEKNYLSSSSTHFYSCVCFGFQTGIAPITVVTHRDKLRDEEECKDALDEASAATGSSTSHTFFVWNYTKENKERNPEVEKIIFDILHSALTTAEQAVKFMKQNEKNKQEDEMMKALEGVTDSGQVAPDSEDGNL